MAQPTINTAIAKSAEQQLANLPQSLNGLLSKTHQRILEAKGKEETINSSNFGTTIAWIVALHGIKNVPDTSTMRFLWQCFEEKYCSLLSLAEVQMAFNMNVRSELTTDDKGKQAGFEHYHSVTVEWFCKVLNAYIEKRMEATAARTRAESAMDNSRQNALAAADGETMILRQLITDRRQYEEGTLENFTTGATTDVKLQYMGNLFEVDTSEENIEAMRANAVAVVIRALQSRRRTAELKKNFGVVVEITHQISRIRKGKLITNTDEGLIQAHTREQLITQVFSKYPADEFCGHIEATITEIQAAQ